MRHKSIVERQVIRQQTINLYMEAKEARNLVLDFPKNQAANIEKFKQKIIAVKADKLMSLSEKSIKIAWCEKKIAEITASIEMFYVQHPWVKREVLTK